MRLSLWARLSLVLFAVLLAAGAITIFSHLRSTESYQAEVNQQLNQDLAAKIAHRQGWDASGLPPAADAAPLFHDLMMLNPLIELYVLDPQGRVVAYSADKPLQLERIDPGPIRRFLEEGAAARPLLGDDPRTGGRKVFSVTELPSEPAPGVPSGYLYVILPSRQYDSAARMVAGSYILRLGLWRTVAALTVALALGVVLFRLLTRRLRRLARALERFRRRGDVAPEVRELAADPRDEVDELAASLVAMADQISRQVGQLLRADAQRRELVAGVSHDLRTPLTILQGYLETLLLKAEELSPDQRRRSLESALRQAERLSVLVKELFEMATLEGEGVRTQPEAFSLAELMQDVAQKFTPAARQEGVALETACAEDVPWVRADLRLIERVLDNLLDNAIRHTPPGGRVRLSCRAGGGRAEIEVEDTGEGIPADELPRIFDPFYRRQGRQGAGGAGLGLAIARRVLELHGSTIEVDSRAGEGARFRFRLPAA